jgi:hypothetical protein
MLPAACEPEQLSIELEGQHYRGSVFLVCTWLRTKEENNCNTTCVHDVVFVTCESNGTVVVSRAKVGSDPLGRHHPGSSQFTKSLHYHCHVTKYMSCHVLRRILSSSSTAL